jgi:putative GTP pyrophosphokinase
MQDIAGCRLIVADIEAQDRLVEQLARVFSDTTTVDRRETPSHGYRAVHVIVRSQGHLIEVQVRTSLQHLWAELSEKLSDVIDASIKYGGGSNETRTLLATTSELVGHTETADTLLRKVLSAPEGSAIPDSLTTVVSDLRDTQRQLAEALTDTIASVGRLKGGPSALPD